MRILITSDTHNFGVPLEKLPDADMFIHCGDATMRGTDAEWKSFCNWSDHVVKRYKHFVFTPGNHDLNFNGDTAPGSLQSKAVADFPGICLLNDSITINGLTIFGSPVTLPIAYEWHYFYPDKKREAFWKSVSEQTDIDLLLTHDPPHGILDRLYYNYENKGCPYLRKCVEKLNPTLHCFGHIHEEAGYKEVGTTSFLNASFRDQHYSKHNRVYYVELEKKQRWELALIRLIDTR